MCNQEPLLFEHVLYALLSIYRLNSTYFPILRPAGYGKVFLVRKVNAASKGQLFAMKVLKKVTVVRKRKVMEHTITERNVLEAIRDFPFLVTLHYAFQTDSKLHLIMGTSVHVCNSQGNFHVVKIISLCFFGQQRKLNCVESYTHLIEPNWFAVTKATPTKLICQVASILIPKLS